MLKPITKWAKCVHQTERIPEYIAMGFRAAMTGRQGPAFLEIPTDVLFMKVEEEQGVLPGGYRPTGSVYPDPEVVARRRRCCARRAAGDHGRLGGVLEQGHEELRICRNAARAGVPERDGPRVDRAGARLVLQPQPAGRR